MPGRQARLGPRWGVGGDTWKCRHRIGGGSGAWVDGGGGGGGGGGGDRRYLPNLIMEQRGD